MKKTHKIEYSYGQYEEVACFIMKELRADGIFLLVRNGMQGSSITMCTIDVATEEAKEITRLEVGTMLSVAGQELLEDTAPSKAVAMKCNADGSAEIIHESTT